MSAHLKTLKFLLGNKIFLIKKNYIIEKHAKEKKIFIMVRKSEKIKLKRPDLFISPLG
jgi:hypothetical protein